MEVEMAAVEVVVVVEVVLILSVMNVVSLVILLVSAVMVVVAVDVGAAAEARLLDTVGALVTVAGVTVLVEAAHPHAVVCHHPAGATITAGHPRTVDGRRYHIQTEMDAVVAGADH